MLAITNDEEFFLLFLTHEAYLMFVSARSRMYAVALFKAAQVRAVEEEVGRALACLVLGSDSLAAIILGAPSFVGYGSVNSKKAHRALRTFLAHDSAPAENILGRFILQLLLRKRTPLLPQIAYAYYICQCMARGTFPAVIRAAHPLSVEQIKAIETLVHQARRVKPTFMVQLVPSLIAGFDVVCGDWRFDATLQGRLRRIRTRIQTTLTTQKI
ncbi:MAG: F0F1 ATP synthase subunit delta [Alphaproteobacteria bacterium]|nr:MAG: F0F1 ATP synthase subunit delta [Alphaproteobacteria bacterium]